MMLECLARDRRQTRPTLSEVVRPADGGNGLEPRLKRRRPRRVVASQTHAYHPDALRVEIDPIQQRVQRGRNGDLIVVADVRMIAGLPLPPAFKRQRRQPALEKEVLPM